MLNRNKIGVFTLIVGKQEEVTPGKTRDTFAKEYGNAEPLVIAFNSVLSGPAWKEWKKIRNVLAHRAVPPRILQVGVSFGGTPRPETDFFRQESRLKELGPLNEDTTRTRLEWLEGRLERLIKAAESFASRHVPV